MKLIANQQKKTLSTLPFKIGKEYLIRTIMRTYIGRLTRITGKFLELEEAAWIADTGRFADAVKTGSSN